MVPQTYTDIYSGGSDRKGTWTQEFKASLGNVAVLHLQKKSHCIFQIDKIYLNDFL